MATPQQGDGNVDVVELGVRNRPGLSCDEPTHRPLDVGIPGARSRVGLESVVPVRIALAGGIEVEQGEAIESFGVPGSGAKREPDGDVAEMQWHAIGADTGRGIDDEPSNSGTSAGGVAGGEATDE
ncbi:MAG TPA: hypothetical protein VIT01_01840 [Acidimicrobiales bacterium]